MFPFQFYENMKLKLTDIKTFPSLPMERTIDDERMMSANPLNLNFVFNLLNGIFLYDLKIHNKKFNACNFAPNLFGFTCDFESTFNANILSVASSLTL